MILPFRLPNDAKATIRFLDTEPMELPWVPIIRAGQPQTPPPPVPPPATLAEAVVQQGFADETEFHAMVASLNMTDQETRVRFRFWQTQDGSRAGLQAILDRQPART